MGINIKNLDSLGSVTPQCNDCGICLCWDISEAEYLKWQGFWDEWKCQDCNPNYKGSYERYKKERIC